MDAPPRGLAFSHRCNRRLTGSHRDQSTACSFQSRGVCRRRCVQVGAGRSLRCGAFWFLAVACPIRSIRNILDERASVAQGRRAGVFVDSLLEQSSTARDHEQLNRTGFAKRRLNDGREFRIVKIFYEPADLEQHWLDSVGVGGFGRVETSSCMVHLHWPDVTKRAQYAASQRRTADYDRDVRDRARGVVREGRARSGRHLRTRAW